MRFIDVLSAALCAFVLSACASQTRTTPTEVFIPDEAWADVQRERALSAIPNRDVTLAQSLFDEGWNPYFSFPPIDVFAGNVSSFNWRNRAWERTSLDTYLNGSPDWQNMFSLSDIPTDGAPYMPRPWRNLICQNGFSSRCMIAVTQAGFDEIRWLEVDTESGTLPQNGFDLPVARANVDWVDEDSLLVAIGTDETDTGPTGYPLTVRLLRRGESLSDARILYRGPDNADEVNLRSGRNAMGRYRIIVATAGVRVVDVQFVDPSGHVFPLDVPVDAEPMGLRGDYAMMNLLEDWVRKDTTWVAGSVIAVDLSDQQRAERVLDAAQNRWVDSFSPTVLTADSAYIGVLEHGVQSVYRAQRGRDDWQLERVIGGNEKIARLVSGDPAGSIVFATLESALNAPTLYQLEDANVVREERKGQSFFAPDDLSIERLTAKGADGVPIPFWRISGTHTTAPNNETLPTILYGYGASNFPTLPRYAADIGRLWLNQGGAYVIAQIRGGGEYGPDWYNSGYGDNRDIPLQDFIAIAEDLVARGLATPQSLGIDGTSDGGRLVAGAALLRPDLFAAAVSRDGAVYIEAGSKEGSPILAQDLDLLETAAGRELADRYWPERLFDARRGCAPMLLTSWRGDQRVPATQSRALAAKLLEAGCDTLLIERDGGNHATIDAELLANVYGYFADKLGLSPTRASPEAGN